MAHAPASRRARQVVAFATAAGACRCGRAASEMTRSKKEAPSQIFNFRGASASIFGVSDTI
jgi:hypothetical protein